mgnify:CR=1 FL=1
MYAPFPSSSENYSSFVNHLLINHVFIDFLYFFFLLYFFFPRSIGRSLFRAIVRLFYFYIYLCMHSFIYMYSFIHYIYYFLYLCVFLNDCYSLSTTAFDEPSRHGIGSEHFTFNSSRQCMYMAKTETGLNKTHTQNQDSNFVFHSSSHESTTVYKLP